MARHVDPGRRYVTDRLTIRMPFVHEDDSGCADYDQVLWVEPDSPKRLRRIADQIGRYFLREGGYDFPPYDADDPAGHVVALLPTRYFFVADGIYYAGAIGIAPVDVKPEPERALACWVWVHPYRRGSRIVDDRWSEVLRRFPGLVFDPPYTRAGLALARRLDAVHPCVIKENP